MTKTITVTQDHINQGHPQSCSLCPIALALQAAGFEEPRVGKTFWRKRPYTISNPLPLEAQDFIRKFDFDKTTVQPFSFEVSFIK